MRVLIREVLERLKRQHKQTIFFHAVSCIESPGGVSENRTRAREERRGGVWWLVTSQTVRLWSPWRRRNIVNLLTIQIRKPWTLRSDLFLTFFDRFVLGLRRIQKTVKSVRSEIAAKKEGKLQNTDSTGGLVNQNADAIDNSADGESLEDLVRALQRQIKDSDWLQENTAEKWASENPELAKAFLHQDTNKWFHSVEKNTQKFTCEARVLCRSFHLGEKFQGTQGQELQSRGGLRCNLIILLFVSQDRALTVWARSIFTSPPSGICLTNSQPVRACMEGK